MTPDSLRKLAEEALTENQMGLDGVDHPERVLARALLAYAEALEPFRKHQHLNAGECWQCNVIANLDRALSALDAKET